MLNDDKNEEDSIFKDFEYVPDNVETDQDISDFDEDTIEKALKNIVNQMNGTQDGLQEQPSSEPSVEETKEENTNSIESKNEEKPTDADNEEESSLKEDIEEQKEKQTEEETESVQEEISESNTPLEAENNIDNNYKLSTWEELNDSNDVVKKYIVYISRDFVPYIDSMSPDQRSAYINDAIQYKIDLQNEKRQKTLKRNAVIHMTIAIFTIILLTPVCLWIAHKAIIATFDNYKYSQENFEKLYKHRFEKDKAYMRSLEYNKELEKKIKESSD